MLAALRRTSHPSLVSVSRRHRLAPFLSGPYLADSWPAASEDGFTLVEILVALLFIGVAIIGIAALYTDTTEIARGSEPRLRAAELAQQIAGRITANPSGRTGYASVVGVLCDQASKPKRAEDAAAVEAACWHDEVAAQLPSGMGSVTRDATTSPPTYVVAVSWSAPEGGAASYVIRVQSPEGE